jgi:hypothetical protein
MPSSLAKSKAAITPELRHSTRRRKSVEDAQRITRLSLFGPIVLKNAVRGMLSLVNIEDVDGLSKGMLLMDSEKLAYHKHPI